MRKVILILSVFVTTQIYAQTLTIEACQDSALKNYPLIRQLDLIEKSKELTLSNANKAWLPQLDITLIGGILEGMPSFSPAGSDESSSLNTQLIAIGQLNQTIWDGGMTKAGKQIIEANAKIEMADMQINLYQLRERINNLYFGILLIDEQIVQLELLKETLKRNKKRVQNAIENGTAFKSDEDELKVELINVDQKRIELEFNKMAYIKVLSLMTGEEIGEDATFQRPTFESDVTGLKVSRPELSKFNSQRLLVDAQARLNKATLIPKFGLMGFGVFLTPGQDFGASKLDNLYVAGLSMSWQLGPLYKNGNNKKLTEINLQRIQNQEETFMFNTNLQLSQTNTELEKYRKLLDQDSELLSLKKSIKEAYSTKYDNGVATMTDLLNRINDESQSKQNMIMHEIQYLMKVYEYLNQSGN